QRSLRLIHAPSGRNKPVKDNLLTFAIELACLVSVVALLALAQVARLVLARDGGGPTAFLAIPLADALRALLGAAPAFALYVFVYATYRFIPAAKPRRSTAAMAAAFCMAAFWTVSSLVQLFASGSRYELLYGVFGSLIVLLVNVYTFFTLYLYCAEYAYVAEHFDALLFGRFYRVSKASGATRIEKALFLAPERLLKAYARNFAAGETVFAAGSEGREAYFVYSGEVGVYLGGSCEGGGERLVASLGAGETVGEMAALLDEPRTATARAERDSTLFVLPPTVFRHFLRSDAEAARRIIDSLSSRLKETNRRLAAHGEAAVSPAGSPAATTRRRKRRA
ncbi:MAG: cyclic nucleotide-binding domain-containing protein, partial [Spirochaetaceae bacterium]|nr:cyclic nucleotide-binding domain-containing protein [Spirochaetaceae bacterium]